MFNSMSTSAFRLSFVFLLSVAATDAALRANLIRSHVANLADVGNTDSAAGEEAHVRIIGGTPSDPGEFPYYVDLSGCGGTLIAPRVVLTACKSNGRL